MTATSSSSGSPSTSRSDHASGYHHGDLPAALRGATAELIAERGPSGFSLREVARRAGVSHAAPAHHFGDSKGLLTAVATEGFEQMNASFAEVAATHADPLQRLTAMGKAYIGTAQAYPGHFAVMCSGDLINGDDPAFAEASVKAFGELHGLICEIRDLLNPDLDVDAAAMLTWSSVHGLAVLVPSLDGVAEKNDAAIGPVDELIEKLCNLMITGYAAR